MKLYAGDILAHESLIGLSIAAFGAWMKILLIMWKEQSGTITKTAQYLCNVWHVDIEGMESICRELTDNGVGVVSNGNVTRDITEVTFQSSRLQSELDDAGIERTGNAERQKRYRDKKKDNSNGNVTVEVTENKRNDNAKILTSDFCSMTSEYESNKKKRKVSKFVRPTVVEVRDYMNEHGFAGVASEEAKKFVNHYESIGWRVGKNSMKSWPAAASNWLSRLGDFSPSERPSYEEPLNWNKGKTIRV